MLSLDEGVLKTEIAIYMVRLFHWLEWKIISELVL
jgi:hypothetical protein